LEVGTSGGRRDGKVSKSVRSVRRWSKTRSAWMSADQRFPSPSVSPASLRWPAGTEQFSPFAERSKETKELLFLFSFLAASPLRPPRLCGCPPELNNSRLSPKKAKKPKNFFFSFRSFRRSLCVPRVSAVARRNSTILAFRRKKQRNQRTSFSLFVPFGEPSAPPVRRSFGVSRSTCGFRRKRTPIPIHAEHRPDQSVQLSERSDATALWLMRCTD
jgi:hypothetical protein